MRVRLYTTTMCSYCVRAKLLLGMRGIPYEEINLSGEHEQRADLVRATGWRTVPQIFLDDEFIGGYHELAALDRTGELARRASA
jgi:glutaredoxin 3